MNNRLAWKLGTLAVFLVFVLFLPLLSRQGPSTSVPPPIQEEKVPQSLDDFKAHSAPPAIQVNRTPSSGVIENAYRNHARNLPVMETGTVSKILPDDNKGSRHQRFIVDLQSGHTVLVAHNIDLAPRIGNLRVGDPITFSGQYEWNAQGGVVHWTHHDPDGRHAGGYLLHNGMTYQ